MKLSIERSLKHSSFQKRERGTIVRQTEKTFIILKSNTCYEHSCGRCEWSSSCEISAWESMVSKRCHRGVASHCQAEPWRRSGGVDDDFGRLRKLISAPCRYTSVNARNSTHAYVISGDVSLLRRRVGETNLHHDPSGLHRGERLESIACHKTCTSCWESPWIDWKFGGKIVMFWEIHHLIWCL